MACHYVKQGWAAVVVDNAGTGEEGDAEHAAGRSSHDYENLARFLLEMDWSWLGYTSYMDQCVLDWVKTRPWVPEKPHHPERLLPGNGTHDGAGRPESGHLCLCVQ